MKILLQRVSRAAVRVDGGVIGAIDQGLLLFVGFGRASTEKDLAPMAIKVANLRVFPDQRGRFDRSLLDVGGAALLVPQFTLYADTRKGRRPDFTGAMPPDTASSLFDRFVLAMGETGVEKLETGRFGSDMQVELVNDGPVTILV